MVFEQQYVFYQTRDIETTELNLRAGDDVARLDPGFRFLPVRRVDPEPATGPAWELDPDADSSNCVRRRSATPRSKSLRVHV